MKRIITAALVAMIVTVSLSAQDASPSVKQTYRQTSHEISISYGEVSFADVFIYPWTAIGGAISGTPTSKLSGIFSAEYFYFPKQNRYGLGIIVDYDGMHQTVVGDSESNMGQMLSDINLNGISIMPAFKIGWFNTKYFGMYSKIGLGVWILNQKDKIKTDVNSTQISLAAHVCPVGMDFGGKYVRGFVEVGAGWQGILTGGLRVNL